MTPAIIKLAVDKSMLLFMMAPWMSRLAGWPANACRESMAPALAEATCEPLRKCEPPRQNIRARRARKGRQQVQRSRGHRAPTSKPPPPAAGGAIISMSFARRRLRACSRCGAVDRPSRRANLGFRCLAARLGQKGGSTMLSRRSTVLLAVIAAGTVSIAWADNDRDDDSRHSNQSIQLGPRPFYLVDGMDEGPLKDKLMQCKNGPFRRTDFSIGHRGSALQFPEHTKEAYNAGARMGAGIVECDVTFTRHGDLVCRHAQNDLHTTTNILLTPLAATCIQPFKPAT